jgi:hypothetical protein
MGIMLSIMLLYVQLLYLRTSLCDRTLKELRQNPPQGELRTEWARLSVEGTSSIRVIALAEKMASVMTSYSAAKHMMSSFHSQVKFLAKKGRLFLAFIFYMESRRWAQLALTRAKYTTEPKNPIDFEILGASDFGVAKAPYVGWLLSPFGFKKRAIEFLKTAELEALKEMGNRPAGINGLAMALISSKLYALTRDEKCKQRLSVCGLRRDMDQDALRRIAKWFGFKSVEELHKFCNI